MTSYTREPNARGEINSEIDWALRWSPATATASVAVEADPILADDCWLSGQEVLYSVRVPALPTVISCPRCGRELVAAGPTGFANELPICDHCLLEGSQQLGLMLALVSVTRTYAVTTTGHPEERRAALAELGAFARVYERIAARNAPLRLFLPHLAPEQGF